MAGAGCKRVDPAREGRRREGEVVVKGAKPAREQKRRGGGEGIRGGCKGGRSSKER